MRSCREASPSVATYDSYAKGSAPDGVRQARSQSWSTEMLARHRQFRPRACVAAPMRRRSQMAGAAIALDARARPSRRPRRPPPTTPTTASSGASSSSTPSPRGPRPRAPGRRSRSSTPASSSATRTSPARSPAAPPSPAARRTRTAAATATGSPRRAPARRAPHGTHVAGIAAATTNNGTGVAGTAPDAQAARRQGPHRRRRLLRGDRRRHPLVGRPRRRRDQHEPRRAARRAGARDHRRDHRRQGGDRLRALQGRRRRGRRRQRLRVDLRQPVVLRRRAVRDLDRPQRAALELLQLRRQAEHGRGRRPGRRRPRLLRGRHHLDRPAERRERRLRGRTRATTSTRAPRWPRRTSRASPRC